MMFVKRCTLTYMMDCTESSMHALLVPVASSMMPRMECPWLCTVVAVESQTDRL